MIRIQHKCLVTGVVLACLLAMITHNRSAEKQFSFNKDFRDCFRKRVENGEGGNIEIAKFLKQMTNTA